jgi:hypothetical protein
MTRSEFIVKHYREQAPENYDPQAVIATATLIIAAIVTAVVSAGVGAYSAYAQGQAQADAAKYNKAVAKNNALAATQQAQYEADRIRDRNRRIVGQSRADFAKAGVDISGSASDVLTDSATQGEMDVAAAIYTGRISATQQHSAAQLFGFQSRTAEQAGYTGAAAQGLSGLSSALSIGANPRFAGASGGTQNNWSMSDGNVNF